MELAGAPRPQLISTTLGDYEILITAECGEMTLTDIISVLAVLLSPLVALQVSELLQRRRERRERRLFVFKTLMATRASGLAPEHVQALNMIDVEYHGTDAKSKAVLNAWKAYLDHLNSPQLDSAVWGSRREDMFVDLLYEMSRHLEYDFDKTHIRRTSYFPKGFGDLELDQLAIRKGIAAIMNGRAAFPIHVVGGEQAGTTANDHTLADGTEGPSPEPQVTPAAPPVT